MSAGQRIAATASPVAVGDVPTISDAVRVELVGGPFAGAQITVLAQAGSFLAGQAFAVRYLSTTGAQRVLCRVASVEASGAVLAIVLTDPAPAPERSADRHGLKADGEAVVVAQERSSPSAVTLMNVSNGGVAFTSPAIFTVGDVLRVTVRNVAACDFEVVRRWTTHQNAYAAEAVDPVAGHAFCSVVVQAALSAEERDKLRRQRLQKMIDRQAPAAEPEAAPPPQRMFTRPDS